METSETSAEFVHLHLHSQYSLLDGAVRLSDLIERLKELNMNAVAVTDHGNMFGVVDFYTKAIASGIKAILGAEVYVAPEDRFDKSKRGSQHLVLLAKNAEGYRNLRYLVSMGYLEGFYYNPRIDFELLKEHTEGLICTTACLGGVAAVAYRQGGYDRLRELARKYRDAFEPGHFFLEVQSNGYDGQEELNRALRKVGQELDIPLVATNDCHYLNAADAKAHSALMCIQKGITLEENKNSSHQYSDQLYVKSAEEMIEALKHYPDAIENTIKIAEMCEEVVPTGPLSLPDYGTPDGVSIDEHLRQTAHNGLNERFEEFAALEKSVDTNVYRKRLDLELDVICEMGFPGYFMIVQDFIGHAREQGIPVGPGRGSGAGSLVAYSLRITDLDPLPLNLLFERFLNPERISMPDFDIDFCKDRREEVIAYVVEKYGKDNVGQIATFHQLKSRSVVRDVGRAMGMAFPEVDPIAKLVPENTPLKEAFAVEPRLTEARKNDYRVDELLTYAERLESLNRHAGMHAAGVVIGNKPLWEYVPVFKGPDRDQVTSLVSQLDMNYVEKAGLVKFDFLGLKTLTVIDTAVRLIEKSPVRDEPLNISAIPMDDSKVYDLISQGNTWGVFQLESRGFQELLKKLKPDCFEDIVAAVALYRPGPLEGGMVDQFVECKHGRRAIEYPHIKLEGILKETYGVIVYQEQVMQSAQILAGYSLGAADIMRRAMGKKKVEVMETERLTFVAGCEERGIAASTATSIFDLIAKFAGYGFNKSHSAAYALITYQTAWLKTHFPVEFEAALLTCDREDSDKVTRYIRSGREAGVEVLPPSINQSEREFSVLYKKDINEPATILFGLGAIKGVGDAALTAILEARAEEGAFDDIFEFAGRVDLSKVNKGVVESLIKGGAFDSTVADTDLNRGQVFAALEQAIERGKSEQKDRETGQISLFGAAPSGGAPSGGSGAPMLEEKIRYDHLPSWDERTLLGFERNVLGFYMSGHPMERVAPEAKRLADCSSETIGKRKHGDKVSMAGMPMGYSERMTKSGKRLGLFALEDLDGRVEVVVYSDSLAKYADVLKRDEPLLVKGTVRVDQRDEEERRSLALTDATPLEEVRYRRTREVHVCLDGNAFAVAEMSNLKTILETCPGRCDSFVDVILPGAGQTVVALPEQYRVAPSDDLIARLDRMDGVLKVRFS